MFDLRTARRFGVAAAFALAGQACASDGHDAPRPAALVLPSAQRPASASGAVHLRADAWPMPQPGGHGDALGDARLADTAFVTHPDAASPWSFVLSVDGGPRRLEALVIDVVDAAPRSAPAHVTVYGVSSAAEVSRARFGTFVRDAVPIGEAVLDAGVDPVVLRFPAATSVGVLWVRVTANRGGETLQIDELWALEANVPSAAVTMRPIDAPGPGAMSLDAFPALHSFHAPSTDTSPIPDVDTSAFGDNPGDTTPSE